MLVGVHHGVVDDAGHRRHGAADGAGVAVPTPAQAPPQGRGHQELSVSSRKSRTDASSATTAVVVVTDR